MRGRFLLAVAGLSPLRALAGAAVGPGAPVADAVALACALDAPFKSSWGASAPRPRPIIMTIFDRGEGESWSPTDIARTHTPRGVRHGVPMVVFTEKVLDGVVRDTASGKGFVVK